VDEKIRFCGMQRIVGRAVDGAAPGGGSLGYSTIYTPDHFNRWFAPVPRWPRPPQATGPRVRVGAPGLRQRLQAPGRARQEAATTTWLSTALRFRPSGRVEKTDYDTAAFPYDRPGLRIERRRRRLTVFRGLWADGSFSFGGEALPRSATWTDVQADPAAGSADRDRGRGSAS